MIEACIILLIGWACLIFIGKQICKAALFQLGRMTDMKISTDKISYGLGGGIKIKGFVIRPKDSELFKANIIKADVLRTHFSWSSLLKLKPGLSRISFDNAVLSFEYDNPTGATNLDSFAKLSSSGGSGEFPTLRFTNSRVVYTKLDPAGNEKIADIQFRLKVWSPRKYVSKKKKAALPLCAFSVETKQWDNFGAIKMDGSVNADGAEMSGSISADESNPRKGILTAERLTTKLKLTDDMGYHLQLDGIDMAILDKTVDIHFAKFKSLFPQKLNSFELLQDIFERFKPGGQIDLSIAFFGSLKSLDDSGLEGTVNCKDVWICDSNFVYPIEHCTGTINVTGSSAELIDLVGRHNDVVLSVNGFTKKNDQNCQIYRFEVASDNMALDDDLYNALSSKEHKLWDDFSPEGIAGIHQVVEKTGPNDRPNVLTVNLKGTNAYWKIFPYPLRNLQGKLIIHPEKMYFEDVISTAGDEKVIVNGSVSNYSDKYPGYNIDFEGFNAEANFLKHEKYDECLNKFMPQYMVELIDNINISDTINCKANFNNNQKKDRLDYQIAIDLIGNEVTYNKVAMGMKEATGKIYVSNDRVGFRGVKGVIADNIQIGDNLKPMLMIDGDIKISENQFSDAILDVGGTNVVFDKRFAELLPKYIQDFYEEISPTGKFDFSFPKTKIYKSDDDIVYTNVNGQVNFKQCGLNLEPVITDCNGLFKIEGLYKSKFGFCSGKASLTDFSMRIKNILLDKLNTNLDYEELNGLWASENLKANCYDGLLSGRIEFAANTEQPPMFMIDTGFKQIDLKKFLTDTTEKIDYYKDAAANEIANGHTKGILNGSLSFSGHFDGLQQRMGRCRLDITDMEIGKLSPIAKILLSLRLEETKEFAFEKMLIDSYFQGNTLLINKVDLAGNSVAFQGLGKLDLSNQQIKLELTARGKRKAGTDPGIIESFAEGLGQGIVRLDVNGNVYDPNVTTQTLPLIQGTIGLFGKEKTSTVPK